MNQIFLPEQFKWVQAIPPQANDSGIDGDYISLKTGLRAWITLNIAQGNAAQIAITIEQAQAVDGTGSKVITTAIPIWANEDTATSDKLLRQTDAVGFTTSAAVKNKQVMFLLKPDTLDVENGFDCIVVKVAASDVANLVSAEYYIESRYPQAAPPSAIVD